jgi:hypothetical protein
MLGGTTSAPRTRFVWSVEVPIPRVGAWKCWLGPIERQRWQRLHFSEKQDRVTRNVQGVTRNAQGRIGSGAAMHCELGRRSVAPRLRGDLGHRNLLVPLLIEQPLDGGYQRLPGVLALAFVESRATSPRHRNASKATAT